MDNLRNKYVQLTNQMNTLAEVADKLEENYIKQDIFGSASNEDIKVVKNALEIAESLLWEIDEEQEKVSLCLEQTAIEWEENVKQCHADERDDCDELEEFLEEIKKLKGRK